MAKDIRWLTTANAADMACCDQKTIRRAVRSGYLRAAQEAHGDLRFLESWIDDWLSGSLPVDWGYGFLVVAVAQP